MHAKDAAGSFPCLNFVKTFVLLAAFLLHVPAALGDTADYFYDDLGRLVRVVKGTSGVVYNYDELGNLASTTSATTAGGAPTLTAMNP
ncbi:MAG TPA: RHS repeat domain-containing protein, partial [Geobacteraceae bacterium]